MLYLWDSSSRGKSSLVPPKKRFTLYPEDNLPELFAAAQFALMQLNKRRALPVKIDKRF
jgi:hypothetical protein